MEGRGGLGVGEGRGGNVTLQCWGTPQHDGTFNSYVGTLSRLGFQLLEQLHCAQYWGTLRFGVLSL